LRAAACSFRMTPAKPTTIMTMIDIIISVTIRATPGE
jgi:hypothetical protein